MEKDDMTRKQRTPAEIIAETEARLSKLRVKQAKQNAKSNPEVALLIEELDALRKDIREAKKNLGDGPQSLNARIDKHNAWIEKIENEREASEDLLHSAEDRKTEIEAQIAGVVDNLVTETPTAMAKELHAE